MSSTVNRIYVTGKNDDCECVKVDQKGVVDIFGSVVELYKGLHKSLACEWRDQMCLNIIVLVILGHQDIRLHILLQLFIDSRVCLFYSVLHFHSFESLQILQII